MPNLETGDAFSVPNPETGDAFQCHVSTVKLAFTGILRHHQEYYEKMKYVSKVRWHPSSTYQKFLELDRVPLNNKKRSFRYGETFLSY